MSGWRAPRDRPVRRWVREKALRVVDEVLAGYHQEQAARIDALWAEVHDLRDELRGELAGHADRIVEEGRQIEIRSRRDLFAAAERQAVQESARFAREAMPRAPHFPFPEDTLQHALSLAPSGGMALEFGVFSGFTLGIIATARDDGAVYGFDSFRGLPEDWRSGFHAGAFHADDPPHVPGAELVVGWFVDTLPAFLETHPGPVDLLHVDCDLYSSTQTVLESVGPRLQRGSVVVFDEYFNYPGWRDHEFRAWAEYVAATGTQFTYEGYTIDNEQVVVVLA